MMIFELRSYTFALGDAVAYLTRFQTDGLPLVTRHLPMLGYWLTEGGELNVIHHLWVYRDFAHRAACRVALAADRPWAEDFTRAAILPLVKAQRSAILSPVRLSPVVAAAADDALSGVRRPLSAVPAGTPPLGAAYLTLTEHAAAPEGEAPGFLAQWRVMVGRAPGRHVVLARFAEAAALSFPALSFPTDAAEQRDLMRPAVFSPL